MIYGRWPVKEALSAGPVTKLYLAKGIKGPVVDDIIDLARKKKVSFLWIDREKMAQWAHGNHQGVAAQISPVPMVDLKSVLFQANNSKRSGASILFLDGITDENNVGSIIRSAVFFGVIGVVLPKWRSATVTNTTVKTSAGGALHIPVCRVSNLAQALEETKKAGFWIVGADMKGENVKKVGIPRPFALVLGSEGAGLHHLVKNKCDYLVSLQGFEGRQGVDSLNVGASCSALLHQFMISE